MSPAAWRRVAYRIALALAGATVAAAPASAQEIPEAPNVISPLQVETDHNGVNLVSGKTMVELPLLSVPGAPNLRFDRIQNAAPYFSGRIQTAAPEGGLSTASYSVHTGQGGSESFRCIDFDCESVTGTGSTFIANTFRQGGTGVVWRFTRKHVDTTGTTPRVQQFYASSVTWPNGEVISYTYDTATLPGDAFNRTFYRPRRLSSNLGYYIEISYQAGTFPDAAWSTVTQAALYRAGTTPVLVGRLVYGGNTITDYGNSIADVGGRTFTCSGCNNALGTDVEESAASLTLPGEASPAHQATAVAGSDVVGSVTRDGVSWSYAYQNLRYQLATQSYLYDELTITGPNGFHQVYDIDQTTAPYSTAQRNVISRVTDSIGRSTSFTFDESSRPTRAVYPEGNSVSIVYDGRGNIYSRTTTPKAATGLDPVTETAFVDTDTCLAILCYRPVWYRDGLGRQTDFAYNANGQLTERIDPPDANGVRRRTIVEYETNAAGISRRNVVRVCGTGAACGTTAEIRTEYDYLGDTLLVTQERRIDAARGVTLTTTYTYDESGRVRRVDGPLPGTGDAVYSRYDQFGRKIREVGPMGDNGARLTRVHTYRPADGKITRTDTAWLVHPDDEPNLLSWVEFAYDSRRNPVREMVRSLNSAGATVTHNVLQRSFDQSNRLQCEARRMNPAQFAVSQLPASACDRDTRGTEPNDFGYDRITQHIYDAAGQLLQERRAVDTPEPQTYAAYTYTPNGRRASVTDANGNRAELRYDGFDRLARWVFPSRTTDGLVNEDDYESYGYDPLGNRTSLRKRDGSRLDYQYDNLNRMTRKTVPERAGLDPTHTRDVFYGYNVLDLQTFARFDGTGGEGVTNSYDAFGRLLVTTTAMTGPARSVTRVRDDVANINRLTYGGQTYRYELDDAGRLTDLYDDDGSPALLAHFTYEERGLVDFRDEGNSSVDYEYDRIGRLDFITHGFNGGGGNVTLDVTRYNPANQIDARTRSNDQYAWNGGEDVSRNYAVNGLNQYTAAGGTTFAYDANGNLTRSGANNYVYDVENRLVAASGGITANLRYDPLGRLFEVGGATPSRRLLWDGDALVAEYTTADTLAARFVHGTAAGIDDPLVWYGGGENRRLHADHQGSIVAVTSGTGAIKWINGYDEWGIPNDPVNTGRFQYTGQLWIGELGMYHYKARFYSPTIGRFLQVDSVGYDDGLNLYAYVGNDPVNGADPSGTGRVCTIVTGSLNPACVTVDADFNNDGIDDLSAGQLRRLGNDFHESIQANRGRDISNMGKLVGGTANLAQKTMVRVVSQFIGASVSGSEATQWSNVRYIYAMRRSYFRPGEDYRPLLDETGQDSGRGDIYLGGRVGWISGGYPYDSPSNLARVLLHGMGHTPALPEIGLFAHRQVDRRARELLRAYGLAGGGCWSTEGPFNVEGFPAC